MKKMIAIILMIGCTLSLAACGDDEGKVELTLENFSDYLDVSVGFKQIGYDEIASETFGFDVYSGFDLRASVLGASDLFAYHDVVVTIEVKVSGRPAFWDEYDEKTLTITVSTNIAGNGSTSESGCLSDLYILENSLDASYKVVSVSGYVTQS